MKSSRNAKKVPSKSSLWPHDFGSIQSKGKHLPKTYCSKQNEEVTVVLTHGIRTTDTVVQRSLSTTGSLHGARARLPKRSGVICGAPGHAPRESAHQHTVSPGHGRRRAGSPSGPWRGPAGKACSPHSVRNADCPLQSSAWLQSPFPRGLPALTSVREGGREELSYPNSSAFCLVTQQEMTEWGFRFTDSGLFSVCVWCVWMEYLYLVCVWCVCVKGVGCVVHSMCCVGRCWGMYVWLVCRACGLCVA